MSKTFETRAIAAPIYSVSTDGRPRIEARAIAYDSWSEDLGGFRERMLPGSVTVDADLVALFDHDSSMVLGRVSAGTLNIRNSSEGWDFTAFPPDTQWARDLRVSMERGDIKGCSFRMMVEEDKWYMDMDGQVCRDVIKAQVSEFTVTSMPAYPVTTAEARSTATQIKVKKIIENRIGRTLSADTEKALKDALAALEDATENIEEILASVDPSFLDDEATEGRNKVSAAKAKVAKMIEKRQVNGEGMPTIADLIEELTELFADVFSFYFRAHGAHWNVMGSDFAEYHKLFNDIYDDVYGSVDPLAENLRKLGAPAPFSLPQVVQLRTLADANVGADARALAADLLTANDVVLDQLSDVFDCATMCGQQGLANYIAERLDQHAFWKWQLSASLGTNVVEPNPDPLVNGVDPDDVTEEGSESKSDGASGNRSRSSDGASEAKPRHQVFVPGIGFVPTK